MRAAAEKYRQKAADSLDRWGNWRRFFGSENLCDAVAAAIEAAVAEERARCAAIADNYGREGDRLSKEFACEVADEIAARIRAEAIERGGTP